MIDQEVQNFLNKFHQILGIDPQGAQESVSQFEQVIAQRVLGRFMSDLTDEERKRCEEYMNQKLESTDEQRAEFLQKLRPSVDMLKLAEEETNQLTKGYILHLMQFTNEEQKQQIKTLAQVFLSNN